MRKVLGFIFGVLVLIPAGCELGVDGETFLAYSWTSSP